MYFLTWLFKLIKLSNYKSDQNITLGTYEPGASANQNPFPDTDIENCRCPDKGVEWGEQVM